jgi:hypothetical protein
MNRFGNPTLAHFASLTRCLLIVVGGQAARSTTGRVLGSLSLDFLASEITCVVTVQENRLTPHTNTGGAPWQS